MYFNGRKDNYNYSKMKSGKKFDVYELYVNVIYQIDW